MKIGCTAETLRKWVARFEAEGAAGLCDRAFLARYTVGFERFPPYLMGETGGQPKDTDWAADISGLDAGTIRTLARRMARTRPARRSRWRGSRTRRCIRARAAGEP